MSDYLKAGDTLESFEDTMIYCHDLPIGKTRSIVNVREGDFITYIGQMKIRNGRTYYKFVYSPINDEGEIIGVDYVFYVKNIVNLLEQLGYEVEY